MRAETWALIVIINAAVVGGLFYFYGPVSQSDARVFGPHCAEWISTEFNNGRKSAVSNSWKKRGKLVFEIATLKESGNSASLQLCVVDKAAGSVVKPSILDRYWNGWLP